MISWAIAAAVGAGIFWLGTNIRVVKQFERGVVYRFGRVQKRHSRPGTDDADSPSPTACRR